MDMATNISMLASHQPAHPSWNSYGRAKSKWDACQSCRWWVRTKKVTSQTIESIEDLKALVETMTVEDAANLKPHGCSVHAFVQSEGEVIIIPAGWMVCEICSSNLVHGLRKSMFLDSESEKIHYTQAIDILGPNHGISKMKQILSLFHKGEWRINHRLDCLNVSNQFLARNLSMIPRGMTDQPSTWVFKCFDSIFDMQHFFFAKLTFCGNGSDSSTPHCKCLKHPIVSVWSWQAIGIADGDDIGIIIGMQRLAATVRINLRW